MRSLKGIGKLHIESRVGDGEGIRITKDFLEKLIIQFAKRSAKYIDGTSEAIFVLGEKQIHSVIGPAISDLTSLLMMECPVERKYSKKRKESIEDYNGFLDYWCNYRHTDFFIELKHNHDSYKSSTITKKLISNWKYMNYRQLNPLKGEARKYFGWSRGVVMVGMHIVPIVERTRCSEATENWPELISVQKDYLDELRPQPNWSAIWMLNDQLVDHCKEEYSKTGKTFYPAVMIICRISTIIK